MTKINYSKNTVGCNVDGEVFIHPELYKYGDLYHAVIAHEKKHSKKFEKKDLYLDIFNEELAPVKGDYYKFMLTHTRTFLGWFPVTKIGKHWGFDLEMAVAWVLLIFFVWLVGGNL